MKLADKNEKLAIGLMSGTSLDGVDAALVRITGFGPKTEVSLESSAALSYDAKMRAKLKAVCDPATSDVLSICEMNFQLAEEFAQACDRLMETSEYKMVDVDFISSHGQTIYHIPPGSKEGQVPSTLQIGDISVISQRTGKPVIGDFRTADMAAGGHGAPLVPYVDYLLFGDENKGRALQNIGGIGNVTFLPAGGTKEQVIAFDTGPGNMVLDQVVERVTDGKKIYDHHGEIAAKGNVDRNLIKKWLADPYFSAKPPKSTGREKYGENFAEALMKDAGHLSKHDLATTVTALTAHSIADSYRRFILPEYKMDEMIIGGGGSHNHTLVGMIQDLLPEVTVETNETYGLNSDFKEALAFVVLGNEYIHGAANNLPSATGARHPVIMGKLAVPASNL